MGRRKSFNVTHNDSPQCCHPGEPTHPKKPASVPGGRGDDPVAIYLGKENPQGTEKCKPTGGDKPNKPARPQLPLLQLFRYATPFDWLLMVVASLSSVVHGACLILLMFMFGKVVDVFLDDAHHKAALHAVNWSRHNHTLDTARANRSVFLSILHAENATDLEHLYDRQMEGLLDHTASYTYLLVGSGVAVLVTAYLQVALWFRSSNRQGYRMREALFRSIMKQDIGWFDTHKSGQLNTRLAGDIDKIVEGIGDKIGHFLQWTTVAVCGLLMGFIHGWQLALLVSTCVPVVSISLACMGKKLREFMPKETEAYAAAGSIAEQVFVAVRTVMAFGGEDRETERYTKNLYSARRLAIRKGFLTGTGPAVSVIVIYVMYAVAFWVGSVLIKDGQMTPGQLVSVFYGMIMGAFAVGLAIPHTQGISEAKAVAYELWTIIDTVPSVDWTSSGGLKPTQCRGEVTFDNVQFAYPSRSNKNVLESVSMHAAPGSTVALVGASGCGKSTVVQLIQRFYDVTKGTVSIDGHDVRQLNVQWVRQHIGLVSQEPVLFGTTIEENIRFGEQGVTHQQIDDACRKANAYDFIQQLPDKYKTLVGERGTQLSGGQKQRIAIARALVREPKILLLDEATSALDTSSEAVVQEALDKAREGRTTIMIAHRLCTVRNADTIYGIRDGAVVESGNHEELVTIEDGVYSTMLNKQEVKLDLDIHTKTTTCASNGAVAANAQLQTPDSKKQTTTNNTTKSSPSPLWWILKQNRPELLYIALGSVGAFVHGMKQPLLALVFSQMFNVFEGPESAYYPDIHLYASLFLALGLLTGLAIIAQNYYFAHAGAYLTERIRIKMFKKYLSMDVSFFDQPGNHSGVIVNKLVNTPKIMQGATGTQLGFLLQSLAGLGCGLAVAFYYSWKMTVGVVGFVPIMFAGGIITQKLLTGASKEGRDSRAQASTIGVQAIRNIRTVTSLSMQDWFTDAYLTNMRKPYREGIRNAVIHGALYSFTQSCLHFAFAASFAFGAHLVDQGEITFVDMLRVFMGIVFGAMSLGNAAKFVPNYVQSKAASAYLHDLFTSQSTINNNLDTGVKPKTIEGSLQFHGVSFSYPSRQTVPVLQDCSIHVAPGETVALVGTSGCGKTTCVQLMERFYDPTQGDIRLDGVPLTDLSVRWLRAQLGLVAQEPVLFDATIADNIAYGDNSKQVQMCDIIQAAKTANIHEFIAQLPEGYNTHCGVKGTQLSGGQKQRIAIARALIRDPKVLLLDEATSALDTDSEKSVQEALERAQRGRTSLVIAHRLSTIVNADKIVVFQQGRIVEAGTHAQLLAQQGVYYQLNKAQVS